MAQCPTLTAARRPELSEPATQVTNIAPVGSGAEFRVRLTNVLNRPVTALVSATIEGLQVQSPAPVTLAPGAAAEVPLAVLSGNPRPDNRYPARVRVDCGADGAVEHWEDLRVNRIARATVTIDGSLDDWAGALPQPIEFSGQQTATLTEKAWLPFMPADESVKQGLAVAWLAHDANNLYLAARVHDTTPHPGAPRFADNRHWDDYFYPEVSYSTARPRLSNVSARWTGQVVATASGETAFATLTDDGVRLWIDGKPLVDNWTPHGPTWNEGTLPLEAGRRYDLRLEWFQGGGGARLQLAWTPPGKGRVTIPATQLCRDGQAAPGSGLACAVFRDTSLSTLFLDRTDPQIDFTWDEGPLTEASFGPGGRDEHRWPAGVRCFSYRRDPVLPCGSAPNFDNLQIAFNVLPPEAKREYPAPPGTYAGFISVDTSDYEYALNPVAERWGGGTEVWRLRRPDLPHKHFYPRQPASPNDGPVPGARLVIRHVGSTRTVECAIPWSELPEVQQAMRAGRPVKFTCRVNDSAGVGCLELARGRSISKRGPALYPDWAEHWENQVEFGWAK